MQRPSLRFIGSLLIVLQLGYGGVFAQQDKNKKMSRVYRDRLEPHWSQDGERFWYRNQGPEDTQCFVMVQAALGQRAAAFDHQRLATVWSEHFEKPLDPNRLPIKSLRFCKDPNCIDLLGRKGTWRLNLTTYALESLKKEGGGETLSFDRSPRPSRRTGPETNIVFDNQLQESLRIFWMDSSGKRQAYGTIKPDKQRRQHTFAGHVWLVTKMGGALVAVFEATADEKRAVINTKLLETSVKPLRAPRSKPVKEVPTFVASPDGAWQAFVRDHNLWLRETADGKEIPLSVGGNPNDSYHRDAQRSRLVGMRYNQVDYPATLPDVTWSPDSKYLLAMRTRAVTPRQVYMVESSPRDQLQPKLHSYPYLKPGDDIPQSFPHLFDVAHGTEIRLDQQSFPNPWSIGQVHWASDSSYVTFLYNQRGHQVMRVVRVDVPSGRLRLLVEEICPTFFSYSGKLFLKYLDKREELIWMSERDGWNHLYRVDMATGKVKNQITQGEWVVRKVERVDPNNQHIYFQAGGLVPGQDPYYVQYCRIDFDGSNLTRLTEGDGHHTVKWSPDRRFLIDTWSRVDQPPIHTLRRVRDGQKLCFLEKADDREVLAEIGFRPERFVAKGRDGQTDIYGIILRPSDFDPGKTYPIVENIYAGPHSAHVPKSYRASLGNKDLLELGFIVVRIDGMGTSHRSKAFHDVCWQNLVDAGFPDRILWMKAAAEQYPYMDLTRVGIFGGSAGGQNALGALLTHGDFYKAAVSSCGCHDNRMDKIWWNEQWMGWPVGPHYVEQSNVTLAPQLEGKLLLILGELDRNVDPASTMQVVDAMVRADEDFDMLVVPGAGHGSGGAYGRRRLCAFFKEHLLEDQ